jgi:hypothetical protein
VQLKPLRDKKQQNPQSQISQSRTLVTPTKGWYVGAPLSAAPDQSAFLLQNAFPEIDSVRARGGSIPFATGMPAFPVLSLMPYQASSTVKMFAQCNGGIYDVTNAGAVGAALVTGLSTTAPFTFVQFGATGQQHLLAANGVDPVQLYDGTSWGTTPAITGLTGSPLNFLFAYQNNIWGLQPHSLDAWYLPGSTIGGPISKYPMAPIFKDGGSLISASPWIIQTSGGPVNAVIFMTDQGEVAIFVGTTPALTWNFEGVYKVAPPVGPNCMLATGGDVSIMTQDAILNVSTIGTASQEALENQSVSAAINPAWQAAVQARLGLSGWQVIDWPSRTMVIVNLPQINANDKTQFINNARTGAWCQYTGWDAQCFAVGGANLASLFYGTSSGVVMQAETSGQDNGKPYTMTIFPSYNALDKTDYGFPSLSQSAERKQIKMVRPRIQSNGALSPTVSIQTDFSVTIPPFPAPGFGLFAGAKWGVAKWGVDVWPGTFAEYQTWVPAFGIGSTVAPVIQVTFDSVLTPMVKHSSTDILFEAGNLFG